MFVAMKTILSGLSGLNTLLGAVGSGLTVYDHFKNQQTDAIKAAIQKQSEKAYARYADFRGERRAELGLPVKRDILGYWESCLERNVLPGVEDMVSVKIAEQEEAEILFPYLLEAWMEVPDFADWLHGLLSASGQEETLNLVKELGERMQGLARLTEELKQRRLTDIVRPLSAGQVMDAGCSCSEKDIRRYFMVNSRFPVMLKVISAEQDVPHEQAFQKMSELVEAGYPVILSGYGGLGKTSLMMQMAVRWIALGRPAFWLSLSSDRILTESDAEVLYQELAAYTACGGRILLCIDNPFEGRTSFSNLRKMWQDTAGVQLVMAERTNRLSMLADPSQDTLLDWFDDARVLLLRGKGQKHRSYQLKDYEIFSFWEQPGRKKEILKKCTSFLVRDGLIGETDQDGIIRDILAAYDKDSVSLVELIYRTLFAFQKSVSKPEEIKLDWEEWGSCLREEFPEIGNSLSLYGVIAAFKLFNTPMPLSLFCRHFGLAEHRMKNCLREHLLSQHIEPVIYKEESQTLQPKHDVIAELFFLFHKQRVSVNSLISDLLDSMNEEEMELLLQNMVVKKVIREKNNHYVGEIAYWEFMKQIMGRVEQGEVNLTGEAAAYLCLGYLWAGQQKPRAGSDAGIATVLAQMAPDISLDIVFLKLYAEWGIWARSIKDDKLAEEKFRAVIETDTENVIARTELGRLLAKKKGREKEAERVLREAMKIERKHIQSRTELGKLLAKQAGREKEAEKVLREAMKIEPKHIQSRTELGRLLAREAGREKEAEEVLREAIAIDPKNLHPHTELGRLLAKQAGREKEAEEMLRKAIRIDSKNLPPYTELGRLLAKQKGREKEAEEVLREAMGIDAEDIQSRTELGRLLWKQLGREKEAEEVLRKAIQIEPENVYLHTELGRLILKQPGREKEAEQEFRKVMETNSRDIHARTALAGLYEKQGKKKDAAALYQQICEYAPHDSYGRRGLERLKDYL